jgi:acetyl esterase/lipase
VAEVRFGYGHGSGRGRSGPPTLLLQSEHDSIVPAETVRALASKLHKAGAQVIHLEYPQTDHVFDLPSPRFSPSGQAASYEVERFLVLVS